MNSEELFWKGLVEECSVLKLFDRLERQEPFRTVLLAVSLRLTLITTRLFVEKPNV